MAHFCRLATAISLFRRDGRIPGGTLPIHSTGCTLACRMVLGCQPASSQYCGCRRCEGAHFQIGKTVLEALLSSYWTTILAEPTARRQPCRRQHPSTCVGRLIQSSPSCLRTCGFFLQT